MELSTAVDLESPSPPESAANSIIAQFAPLWAPDFNLTGDSIDVDILPVSLVSQLITDSLTVLSTSKTLIELPAPVVIVGDLHGSLIDLLRVLQQFGTPESTQYLFLGDYVDRGPDSISVICLILAFLVRYPTQVFLLRGNHEFAHINQVYGFQEEIRVKYDDERLWERFQEVFSWLSLAAIVNRSIFCVHGGLSPGLADFHVLDRMTLPILDYFANPLVADLVWSDPVDSIRGFRDSRRGSGKVFGRDCVETFLRCNGLKFLMRAHQCIPIGWQFFSNMLGVTLFSSSNYCHLSSNKCGVAHLRDDKEIAFFTIDPDSDLGSLPSSWTLPLDGDVGLKRLLRASSRPDMGTTTEDDDDELMQASHITRSQSMARSLSQLT